MSPQEDHVAALGERLQEPQRLGLMIEDTACHDQIELLGARRQKRHEVPEAEGHALQPEMLLDDETFQKDITQASIASTERAPAFSIM